MPGYSCDVKETEFVKFECPDGTFWKSDTGAEDVERPMEGEPWEKQNFLRRYRLIAEQAAHLIHGI